MPVINTYAYIQHAVSHTAVRISRRETVLHAQIRPKIPQQEFRRRLCRAWEGTCVSDI